MTLLTSNSRKQLHSHLKVVSDKPSVCGTLFFMESNSISIGQKFGKLTLVEIKEEPIYGARVGNRTQKIAYCHCECGGKLVVPLYKIAKGDRTSCGCYFSNGREGKLNAKAGDIFGRLTVLDVTDSINAKQKSKALCICKCGQEIIIETWKLWNVKSCGCLKKEIEHGQSNTNLHMIWCSLKQRCLNPRYKGFKDYGGRGIKVCEGFKLFVNFYKIVGLPTDNGLTLDRTDNNLHYSCGECKECVSNNWNMNVRWATYIQQAQNKRNNFLINYKGEILCMSEVARRINIPVHTLSARIHNCKWSIERAISTPILKNRRYANTTR